MANTKEPQPTKTVAQVFEEFLADQKTRLSYRTFLKYQNIIGLLKLYLEGYWPAHNDKYDTITKAGGTFCGTFGPESLTPGYDEFLGYFIPRKVMCGKETMQAAGTVTKKLAKWLVEKGYAVDTEVAQGQAGQAAKDLPLAKQVLTLLEGYLATSRPEAYGEQIQDHFKIERIEPGELWLKPLIARASVIGPVPVPEAVTSLCRLGWDIGGVVATVGDGWRLVEVWNVSP